MTTGIAGGLGSGMEAFGNILVKARLQDMQMKSQAASQMEQLNAQIQGNMNLEEMRQRFKEQKEFPHELTVEQEKAKGRLGEIEATGKVQSGLAKQAFGFNWALKDFDSQLQKEQMADKLGIDLQMAEKDASLKGELMDKDYLLKAAVQAGFQKTEHKNAIEMARENSKLRIEELKANNQGEDTRAMRLAIAKSAMEYAPEPMLDYILADKYGLTLDEHGRPTGNREDMALYLQAREQMKSSNVAQKMRVAMEGIDESDPEGAAKLERMITRMSGADRGTIEEALKEMGIGGEPGAGLDRTLDIFRPPGERAGATATRPAGAESRPGGAESRAATRPGVGAAPAPMRLPQARLAPDFGENLGDEGKSQLTAAMNELNFGDTTKGLVTKPPGSKFFALTGQEGVTKGGRDVLKLMNTRKTGEKFIFDATTGKIREAPAKEAIASPAAFDQVWGPNTRRDFGEMATDKFEKAAWDTIKEASGETGMAKVIQEVRKEHPGIDVQETSKLTEELKVAILRLRAVDKARTEGGFGGVGGYGILYKEGDPGKIIEEVNRLSQEASLGSAGASIKVPAKAMGRGK